MLTFMKYLSFNHQSKVKKAVEFYSEMTPLNPKE